MSRPSDVPGWGTCTRRAWHWSKWILLVVPFAAIMALLLPLWLFNEPQTAAQAQYIKDYTRFMVFAMPAMGLILWVVLFLNAIMQERAAKTPLELEEQERRLLARLKEKYPNG